MEIRMPRILTMFSLASRSADIDAGKMFGTGNRETGDANLNAVRCCRLRHKWFFHFRRGAKRKMVIHVS